MKPPCQKLGLSLDSKASRDLEARREAMTVDEAAGQLAGLGILGVCVVIDCGSLAQEITKAYTAERMIGMSRPPTARLLLHLLSEPLPGGKDGQ